MSGLDGLGWPNPEDEPKPKKTMNSQLEIKLAPTPETDAMEYFDAMCDPDRVVEAEFARKLERERNGLHDLHNKNATRSAELLELCQTLRKERMINAERERDEAQERADTMFAKHVDILDQTRNERDEWKAKYIQQNKDLGCEMMDPNGTIWDYAKKVQHELTVVTKQRDNFEERLRVELGGHPDSELWGDAGLIAATMRCVDALDAVTEQRNRLAAVLLALRNNESFSIGDAAYEIVEQALQSLNQPAEP